MDLMGLYLVVGVFLLILAVLWFLLPFAVFGTKDKLNTLIAEMQDANRSLREVADSLGKLTRDLAREQAEPPRRA